MFGFIDTRLETTVKTNVSGDELNVAVYVLYYYEPHEPVQIIPQIDDTFNLVAKYYSKNGKRIAKELKNTNGDLIRLYGQHQRA